MRIWLTIVFAALLLVSLLMLVSWQHDGVEVPPPVTLAEAQALPDDQLVPRLVRDLAGRLLQQGKDPQAWQKLPEPAKHLWVTAACEPHLARDDLLTFLVIRPADIPDLPAIKASYTALGATAIATALGEVIQVDEGSGSQTVAACREFHEQSHAPPSIHPTGIVNPFTASEKALKAAIDKGRTGELRIAYAKQHLAEIIQAR